MHTRETGGVLTPQGEINHLESAAVPPEVTARFTNNIYTEYTKSIFNECSRL